MKVLQIASSNMAFFQEQIKILEQKGIDCDILFATSNSTNSHAKEPSFVKEVKNKVYGHNLIFYTLEGMSFYPKVLAKSIVNQYDIVHINSGVISPIGILQPKRPVIQTFWGDDILGNRIYGYQSKISKQCAKYADAVIVRSEEMNEALPVSASIIPSGVDLERFRPIDQHDAVEKLGWDHETKYVMFPYDPSQSKKRYPLAEETVEEVKERLNIEIKLKVISGVPHKKMPLYYNASDLLILPSLREGSPNTVKEAMACNTPVVSMDVGDVNERLEPVEQSYVCTSDDELAVGVEKMLKSQTRAHSRQHVKDLSLDRMGDRIISIYQEIL